MNRRAAPTHRAGTRPEIHLVVAGPGPLPATGFDRDRAASAQALIAQLSRSRDAREARWSARGEPAPESIRSTVSAGLADTNAATRVGCARLAGMLRMEDAVPGLARTLSHRQAATREAGARALGRIGGARSADALVRGLYSQRSNAWRLVIELARAAPDHYLESALLKPTLAGVRRQVAVATGLRRCRSSIPALLALAGEGTSGERAAASRALGWIDDPAATPALVAALDDPVAEVRVAAVKALADLGDPAGLPELGRLLNDVSAEVRSAAARAQARLTPARR